MPQDPTYPLITYNRAGGARLYNLAGVAGRATPRISINSWADTYTGSKTLIDAVRASLDGFNGTLTTIKCDIRTAGAEIPFYEPDTGIYRFLQDYFVSHIET